MNKIFKGRAVKPVVNLSFGTHSEKTIKEIICVHSLTLLKKGFVGENVIFRKVAEVTTIRSKCLIAIQINWHPYHESLKLINIILFG